MNVAQPAVKTDVVSDDAQLIPIQDYWNAHLHDLNIATQPVGSPGFFRELDEYRFHKLDYLTDLVGFSAFREKCLLEVGCGLGIDLIRFARAGAVVTGVDISPVAIALAGRYFEQQGMQGDLRIMNGEHMTFEDNSFDAVYAHGVIQYTANPAKMIGEVYRVLKSGGEAILMVYNKWSWLNALAKVSNVKLEHQDAPAFARYSIQEFKALLSQFQDVRFVTERFPVETRLHHGLKARFYNGLFVRGFNLLPKPLVRPFGWHIMAFARK